MNNKALVVIDLQNDITKNCKEIVGRINHAVDWAVSETMPIIYIRNHCLSTGARTLESGMHSAETVSTLGELL